MQEVIELLWSRDGANTHQSATFAASEGTGFQLKDLNAISSRLDSGVALWGGGDESSPWSGGALAVSIIKRRSSAPAWLASASIRHLPACLVL